MKTLIVFFRFWGKRTQDINGGQRIDARAAWSLARFYMRTRRF